ncbi:MAG: hypothetical protein J0L75_07975 [Spirochaetes bacterium]|nr:hypothetical protein [Spirochaetota bacterium]
MFRSVFRSFLRHRPFLVLPFLLQVPGHAHAFFEAFESPIGGAGSPWQTNFCYGRDGTVSSSSTSRQSTGISAGKLSFRGWTCDNDDYNGFWSCRWILGTNQYAATAVEPFGFEVIREKGWLDFDSAYSVEKFKQVFLGIALYSDPSGLVNKVFDNSTSYNFQNGASYFDFVDYEGVSDIARQKIGYYYGAEREVTNELRTAVRPGGGMTNVTNLFLRRYRTAMAPLLLSENFTNTSALPPGWAWGSNAAILCGTSYTMSGADTNCLTLPVNGYIITPPVPYPAHLRILTRSSNTGSAQVSTRVYASTNGTNGPWIVPNPSTGNYWPCNIGANNQNGWSEPEAVADFLDEALWGTNVSLLIVNLGTNGNYDNLRIYGASVPNTNALGFRLTHDGSQISMWVNPNPYGAGALPYPNEWLFLKSEPVLFNQRLQIMVGHGQRCAARPNWYNANRYAHGEFDNLLVRSATLGTGLHWEDEGRRLVLRLALARGETAGVNHVRLSGNNLGVATRPLRGARILLSGSSRDLSPVAWDDARFPGTDEISWRAGRDELSFVLGRQITPEDGSVVRLELDLASSPARPVRVLVNADAFGSMPAGQRGRHATCGWQEAAPEEAPSAVADQGRR